MYGFGGRDEASRQDVIPKGEGDRAGRRECSWPRERLPVAVRDLVLDDQRLRNAICWSVFDC